MPTHARNAAFDGASSSAALFADAVERAAVGMAIISAEGVIRFANPLFSRLIGASPETLAGMSLDDLLRPGSRPDLPRALAAGGFVSLPVQIPGADGGIRVALLDLAPLSAGIGGADLLARLREPGESGALASPGDPPAGPDDPLVPAEVVALIRQELREPLTSIRGYAELIAELVRDPDEMAGLARIIHDEAIHLAWLLEDLALLERLSSHAIDLEIAPIDLNSIVLDAAHRLRPQAGGVAIALELDPGLPPVPGDRDILLQMMSGLIRDALRASPAEGSVVVSTGRVRRRIQISVSGGGPVQDARDLERAFDLHGRAGGGEWRARAQRGFALPIARGIARLHGGRAWAEPRAHDGATIRIALPTG